MGGGRGRRGGVGRPAAPPEGAAASAGRAEPTEPLAARAAARAWSRARRLAAWAWTLAIFVFLWMPPPPPPEIVWPWWDSLVHTGLLAGFGVLWTWRGLESARVLVLGAAVGAVTELGQALLPWERHASWDDLAFDLLGVTLGWIAAGGAWRKRS